MSDRIAENPVLPIAARAVNNVVAAINAITIGNTVTMPSGRVVTFNTTQEAKLWHADGKEELENGERRSIEREGNAVVILGPHVPIENPAVGHDEFYATLVIGCPVEAPRSKGDHVLTVEEKLFLFAADIRTALGVDPTRGGNALNTTIPEPIDFEQDRRPLYVWVPLFLHIRTLLNEPCSL